jgi:hypothetical protein
LEREDFDGETKESGQRTNVKMKEGKKKIGEWRMEPD